MEKLKKDKNSQATTETTGAATTEATEITGAAALTIGAITEESGAIAEARADSAPRIKEVI